MLRLTAHARCGLPTKSADPRNLCFSTPQLTIRPQREMDKSDRPTLLGFVQTLSMSCLHGSTPVLQRAPTSRWRPKDHGPFYELRFPPKRLNRREEPAHKRSCPTAERLRRAVAPALFAKRLRLVLPCLGRTRAGTPSAPHGTVASRPLRGPRQAAGEASRPCNRGQEDGRQGQHLHLTPRGASHG